MAIYTGFIDGRLTFDREGVATMLPFARSIGSATINYSRELTVVETFGGNGIRGASAACPFREELTITLSSEDLVWSFLQAVTGTLARDSAVLLPVSETVRLSAVDLTPASTLTLAQAPAVGEPILVADSQGVQYTVTASGSVLTFDSDLTGTVVTVDYKVAASGTNNELAIGAGDTVESVALYGRFTGCGQDLLIAVPRGVISANMGLEVGSGTASSELMVQALRDDEGAYAYITRITD